LFTRASRFQVRWCSAGSRSSRGERQGTDDRPCDHAHPAAALEEVERVEVEAVDVRVRLARAAVLLHAVARLVRDRDHHSGARHAQELRQGGAEVGHVLERLAAERHVELAVVEGQVVHVSRASRQAEDLARPLAGVLGQVGGHDLGPEQPVHQLGLVALGRAGVEAGAEAQLGQRPHDLERAHVARQQRRLAVPGVEAVDGLVGRVDAIGRGLLEAPVEPGPGLLRVGVHRRHERRGCYPRR
jgi:hypothetical protein